MKKNLFFSIVAILAGLVLTSCGDKDSEGLSRFTFYPSIELEGDSYLVWEKGKAFVDPGYVSLLNGEDVTDKVTVAGSVDTNKSGIYTLTYTTMKNDDGFDASASRTVVVLDPNSAIEGFYLTQPDSYRLREGAQVAYGSAFEILIIDNGDGTYDVDDMLGGWYCQRAGYGTKYAMTATIAIEADGTVTCLSNYVPGWGDGLDDFEGSFDAAASTFHIKAVYAAMDFVQTWVKE